MRSEKIDRSLCLSNLPNNERKRLCTDYHSSCSCEFSIAGEKGRLFTPQNIILRRPNVTNFDAEYNNNPKCIISMYRNSYGG